MSRSQKLGSFYSTHGDLDTKIMADFYLLIALIGTAIFGALGSSDLCKQRCPCVDPMDRTVLLPGPSTTQFYMCFYGTAIKMNCGPGTDFNPHILVCDWPSSAGAVVCSGDPPNCKYEGSGDG